jgi:hypothetical protein
MKLNFRNSEGLAFASLTLASFSAAAFVTMAGCSSLSPNGAALQSPEGAPKPDVAVRTMPVVPGRPARVFIFAGLGDKCEPLAAPQITITEPPAKGDVSLVPGQETTIQYSAQGTCLGRKAMGTAIYYTARPGQEGTDRFSISAVLASKETATRSFEVTIAN